MQTVSPQGHPIIICFGDTATASYPLILIVGREPNSDHPVCNEVGTYDFRKAPHCGFWNASYALAARQVDLTSAQLKRRCIELNGSPLLYADAMPQGLLNSVPNKRLARQNISEDKICSHVSNIFDKPVLDRVKLVILSGLQSNVFRVPRKLIKKKCAQRGIPYASLPFFANQNAPRIDQELKRKPRVILASAVSTFLASGAKQVGAL